MKTDVIFKWLSKDNIEGLFHIAKSRFPELDGLPISLSPTVFCIPQVTHKQKWKMSWVFFLPSIFFLWLIWFVGLFAFLRSSAWVILGMIVTIPFLAMAITISGFHDLIAKNTYTIHFPQFYIFEGKSPLFVMCHEFAHILLEEHPKVTVTLKNNERSANLVAKEKMREMETEKHGQ